MQQQIMRYTSLTFSGVISLYLQKLHQRQKLPEKDFLLYATSKITSFSSVMLEFQNTVYLVEVLKKFYLNKTLHFSSFTEVRSKGIFYSEPELKKVFVHDDFTKNFRAFTGNGNKQLTDRPWLDVSSRQPCCLAVECNYVTYVTDAMSASLLMITTTNNRVNFLKNVGALVDAFSIHERGKNIKDSFQKNSLLYYFKLCNYLEG